MEDPTDGTGQSKAKRRKKTEGKVLLNTAIYRLVQLH